MKAIGKILHLWFGKNQLKELLKLRLNNQKLLDTRYEKIQKATIDGEDDWFLTLRKKDPACALKVIADCDEEKNQ